MDSKKIHFLQKINLIVNSYNRSYFHLFQFDQSAYAILSPSETTDIFQGGWKTSSLSPE